MKLCRDPKAFLPHIIFPHYIYNRSVITTVVAKGRNTELQIFFFTDLLYKIISTLTFTEQLIVGQPLSCSYSNVYIHPRYPRQVGQAGQYYHYPLFIIIHYHQPLLLLSLCIIIKMHFEYFAALDIRNQVIMCAHHLQRGEQYFQI